MLGEQAQLQLQEELKEEPTEGPEKLQDDPQLCVVYGPWRKKKKSFPFWVRKQGKSPKSPLPKPPIAHCLILHQCISCLHLQHIQHLKHGSHPIYTACPAKPQEVSDLCSNLCHYIKDFGSFSYCVAHRMVRVLVQMWSTWSLAFLQASPVSTASKGLRNWFWGSQFPLVFYFDFPLLFYFILFRFI